MDSGEVRVIKAKEGFVLHRMMDDYMILAIGDRAETFRTILQTNETGAFYWRMLEEGTTREEMIHSAMERFEDLDESTASRDISEFLEGLSEAIETT